MQAHRRQNLKLNKHDLMKPRPTAWWRSQPGSCAASVAWRARVRGLPPSAGANLAKSGIGVTLKEASVI
jgi:hypothetical protein